MERSESSSSALQTERETTPETTWPAPVSRANERITKKPFGLFVEPETSPVQPERFQGYHAGTDFELLPGEDAHDVVVRAICSGAVLRRQWISGYGGVLIQSCTYQGKPVTVLYGHLYIDSITEQSTVQAGERLGVLGTGFSQETDGERAHLHLSIHRGPDINFRGYVSDQTALRQWVDPQSVLSTP